MQSAPDFSIVKLGGSLLNWNGLPTALNCWLDHHADRTTVFLVGGGQPVERIREQQSQRGWDDETAHWKSIEAMQASANTFADSNLQFAKASTLEEISNHSQDRIVFQPLRWAQASLNLPSNWEVTSDSIAAELCRQLDSLQPGRCSLNLLKSVGPRSQRIDTQCIHERVALGQVDNVFPTVAKYLSEIHWHNLRHWSPVDSAVRP